MRKLHFTSNPQPTLGVEIELALVDPETGALRSAIGDILEKLPPDYQGKVKRELMQCYLEINSDVCRNVDEAYEDLHQKILIVQQAAEDSGVGLYWTGTHPFSSWREQVPSPSERYRLLLDLLQELGHHLVTFGLHVHVGVESGDKAIIVCNRLLKHLPVLLALSANSPWWEKRQTGLMSHRSKIIEMLPTAGLPTLMSNWSEYVWLVNRLVATGFINTIREIWWDVRPHNQLGTVEVRICDTPGNLHDAMALTALIQTLVAHLSDEMDYGAYQHDGHPMMIRQNKWHAARFGLNARIVDGMSYEWKTARQWLEELIDKLQPTAKRVESSAWLERARQMVRTDNWAQRQLSEYNQCGDYAQAIRRMQKLSKL